MTSSIFDAKCVACGKPAAAALAQQAQPLTEELAAADAALDEALANNRAATAFMMAQLAQPSEAEERAYKKGCADTLHDLTPQARPDEKALASAILQAMRTTPAYNDVGISIVIARAVLVLFAPKGTT